MNIGEFIEKNRRQWRRLEILVDDANARGLETFDHRRAADFLYLYRKASADLNYAQSFFANALMLEYLHGLVGRAYALIYAKRGRRLRDVLPRFFLHEVPQMVRTRRLHFFLSLAFFLAGTIFGAVATAYDPDVVPYFVPQQFLGHETPAERVARIYDNGGVEGIKSAGEAAFFSTFLFTHNIRVCLLYFALGLTFGIGTALLVFYTGAMLGAIMMYYIHHGAGLFFFAWVLPHGVIELTCLIIGGAAGFLVAHGLVFRGGGTLAQSLREKGIEAFKMLFACIAFLVFAGLIEGSISQIHPPLLPYWVKLVFAAIVFSGFIYYLFFFRLKRYADA